MNIIDPAFVHTFAGNPLDRAQHLRKDPVALEALQHSDNSLFLLFHKLNVATDAGGSLAWVTQNQLPWPLVRLYFLVFRTSRDTLLPLLAKITQRMISLAISRPLPTAAKRLRSQRG